MSYPPVEREASPPCPFADQEAPSTDQFDWSPVFAQPNSDTQQNSKVKVLSTKCLT